MAEYTSQCSSLRSLLLHDVGEDADTPDICCGAHWVPLHHLWCCGQGRRFVIHTWGPAPTVLPAPPESAVSSALTAATAPRAPHHCTLQHPSNTLTEPSISKGNPTAPQHPNTPTEPSNPRETFNRHPPAPQRPPSLPKDSSTTPNYQAPASAQAHMHTSGTSMPQICPHLCVHPHATAPLMPHSHMYSRVPTRRPSCRSTRGL